MRYRFYITQFDRPVGKKTKRPLGISLGRISAGEGYDMSLDLSGNLGLYWRSFPFLSLNGCVESLLPITAGEGDGNGLPAEKYEPEVWRFFFGMRSTVDGERATYIISIIRPSALTKVSGWRITTA